MISYFVVGHLVDRFARLGDRGRESPDRRVVVAALGFALHAEMEELADDLRPMAMHAVGDLAELDRHVVRLVHEVVGNLARGMHVHGGHDDQAGTAFGAPLLVGHVALAVAARPVEIEERGMRGGHHAVLDFEIADTDRRQQFPVTHRTNSPPLNRRHQMPKQSRLMVGVGGKLKGRGARCKHCARKDPRRADTELLSNDLLAKCFGASARPRGRAAGGDNWVPKGELIAIKAERVPFGTLRASKIPSRGSTR
jgi:hypothetical protein